MLLYVGGLCSPLLWIFLTNLAHLLVVAVGDVCFIVELLGLETGTSKSTMAVQPCPHKLLKDKVFCAARDNQPQVIQDCLSTLHPNVVKDVLHHCSTNEYSQSTPLIIAALKGHVEVVELLVDTYNVDVNQKVIWNHSGCSALLSAVHCGHLEIVKLLVRNGCDIAGASTDGINAVYTACDRNHLEVLKHLVEYGATVDSHSVPYIRTCLMTACWNGNIEMVEYLLSKGVDPNELNYGQRTALHEAAEICRPDIIRLLLQHGTLLSKDISGWSPLIVAAMKPCSESVQVLLESAVLSELERIEGLELLGARLAQSNIGEAFSYVRQAMKERHKDPNNVIWKPHNPLPTLSNVQESQTLEELQACHSDQHLFRLECLAILSRILGPSDCFVLGSLNEYSDELHSFGRHNKAEAILMYALQTAIRSSACAMRIKLQMHLVSLGYVKMLQSGIVAFFSGLEEVMKLTLEEMEKNKELMCYLDDSESRPWLSYILLALKVAQGQEEGRRLQRLVERFIRLTSGSPVLDAAVFLYWDRLDGLRDLDDLPYDLLVSFLLQCGANVHFKDEEKHTVLHTVASISSSFPDSKLCMQIARTLLGAGALVGVQNVDGETPLDLAGPELAAELQPLFPVSLQSLAATAVVKHNIPFADTVPEHLAEFIEKH